MTADQIFLSAIPMVVMVRCRLREVQTRVTHLDMLGAVGQQITTDALSFHWVQSRFVFCRRRRGLVMAMPDPSHCLDMQTTDQHPPSHRSIRRVMVQNTVARPTNIKLHSPLLLNRHNHGIVRSNLNILLNCILTLIKLVLMVSFTVIQHLLLDIILPNTLHLLTKLVDEQCRALILIGGVRAGIQPPNRPKLLGLTIVERTLSYRDPTERRCTL